MNNINELFDQINNKIKESNNIAIISHRFPDADTIWSITAFYEAMKINFPEKRVEIINFDWINNSLSFIPNSDKIIKEFKKEDYDLLIFLDVAVLTHSWFNWNLNNFINDIFVINIDHHKSNSYYWNINLVDISSTSVTIIVYKFLKNFNYKINKNIATSLLAWIYTDSWSFCNPNTNPETFFIARDLVLVWWDIQIINSNLFFNNNKCFLDLLSIIFWRLKVTKGNFAVSYLTKDDMIKWNFWYEDLDSIVWRLWLLEGVDYVLFLYEKWNLVKWSLRTINDNIDLSQIASLYWWWWHKKASAFTLEWKIKIIDSKNIWIEKNNGTKYCFSY